MPGAEPLGRGVPAPLPDAFGLVLDADTAVGDAGRVLVGGRPRRVLRLSDAGAAVVAERLAQTPGARILRGPAAGVLARRLVDAGIAHPVPPAGVDGDEDRVLSGRADGGTGRVPPAGAEEAAVTVVVPVRDRPAELARCLRALGDAHPVLVVDDGSLDPSAVLEVARAAGAEVLRRPVAGGPAAARNDGLRRVRTPLVAFLDSDCLPPRGWPSPLLGHLLDPATAAVAPRVVGWTAPRRGDTAVARWGRARSPLDLGTRPARVEPGGAVSYVPTAALVVRVAALENGFDPALRHGEDVDLVWRLHDAGHRVRYDPSVVVRHEEPSDPRAFLARRHAYGRSAGPLSRRHGSRLAPVVLAPRPTLVAGLALGGRPRIAAAALAVEAGRQERALRGPGVPRGTGARAAVRAVASTVDGLSRTAAMAGLPALAALAVLRPGARRPVAALVLTAPLTEWAVARRVGRSAGLDPLRWTLLRLADDVAYGSGVLVGAASARAPRAVLPLVPRAPRRAGQQGRRAGDAPPRTAVPEATPTGGAPRPAAGGR